MRTFIHPMHLRYLAIGLLLGVVLAGVFAVWMLRVKPALKMSPIKAWHKPGAKEILLEGKFTDFSKYAAEEKRFIKAAYDTAEIDARGTDNRYERESISSPYKIKMVSAMEAERYGENGNASFIDRPANGPIRGGVLLIHGLSDSPYHMRAVARIFVEQGFCVIALRLPGHGTIPGALTNVKWQDWYKAVKAGVKMVENEIRDLNDAKLILGGFSTGGALTLRYVLESVNSDTMRRPDKLFLFSPAIAVPSEAQFADFHKALSWISKLERLRWVEIKPEYDPYKYNSFPKNGGAQIYGLTQANLELVKKFAADSKRRDKVPPIYGYQSIVDATVIQDSLTELLAKIGNDKCELMMFDLNRAFTTYVLPDKKTKNPLKPINRNSTLYVVTNYKKEGADQFERQVQVTRYSNRNETAKAGEHVEFADSLAWPANVFALSHGSIPISPEDPVYGKSSLFETLNPRGEKEVLAIESDDLIRIRYNPFFEIIKWHIEETLKR